MLETKGLVKVYRPKKGVPVRAVDGVNLKFADKGMVFLLGKSGSGKSTLLNLLGGLDVATEGEIFINGVSTKTFKQSHFDSYRNTYVGFIFQEYNILEEFTVGANIALALELQNQKATDEKVNEILNQVDLEGYGDRKPNELSGGQKQRVAIARALVKNPQIIMADEPTGALDSNTGKQIFDTLKKLSSDKLVVIVSHDREFAENYADRIIELSDGKVISDVEYTPETEESTSGLEFSDDGIVIKAGYHITEEDRARINEYIQSINSDLKISVNRNKKKFSATNQELIKSFNNKFELIKSKLSLKNSFKIGAGALKYKKIRLVITILLSCIAFGLFGLADTFAAYNHTKVCTNSLLDSGVNYISLSKSRLIGVDKYAYWSDYGHYMSEKEIETISKDIGIEMNSVYVPRKESLAILGHINPEADALTKGQYQTCWTFFSGYTEVTDKVLETMDFSLLAGRLPDGAKDEIAISEFIFETFKKCGYTDGVISPQNDNKLKYEKISDYSDMLGKSLNIGGVKFTIVGIIDTGFNIERYAHLSEEKKNITQAESFMNQILYNEFTNTAEYSYSSIAMVGEGWLKNTLSKLEPVSDITEGYITFHADNFTVDSNFLARLSDIKDEKIIWVNGEKTELGEKEIIITLDTFERFSEDGTHDDYMLDNDGLKKFFGDDNKNKLTANQWMFDAKNGEYSNVEGYKIVGFVDRENSKISSTVICSDSLFKKMCKDGEDKFSFCIGKMPKDKDVLTGIVEYCYNEDSRMKFPFKNAVTYELDSLHEIFEELSTIFLYIGIGFMLFASIMLANFIAMSISYKKQEIGILRAIGSRSKDVFKIFFSESFIIAMINFVLSSVGVGVATALINWYLRTRAGILVTVLSFTARQVILLFIVSVAVAWISSYLPVRKIASKKPIDAINNR